MDRHNGPRGRFEGSDEGSAKVSARPVGVESGGSSIAANTAGWSGERMIRHNGPHGR